MNAVIYARYSHYNQREESIEGQLRVGYEYAAREGLTVVGEYIDRALTGRSDDRPEFQRMIDDAKKHAFERVIVYKLDRFARNRYDSAIYKHKLKLNGVKVLSAMENIGDNPEGIILEAVLEASAEYYSLELSQKVKRGRHESASKGNFVGGTVPIWLDAVGGKLVLNENTAPATKYFLEQYAEGRSQKEIIREINERGYRNKQGKPFSYTAFQNTLKSKKTMGILTQGDSEVVGGCPAIITQDTFDKIQARLTVNRQSGARNKAKVEYLLSGKLFCGMCGSTMIGVGGRSEHSGVYHYYSCSERRKTKTCKKKHERKDFVEWYVVEQTIEYVLAPARIDFIAESVVAQYDSEFSGSSISDLEKRIAKTERDIEKAVDGAMEAPTKASRGKFYERMERLEEQKTELENDLSKLRIASKIRFTVDEIKAWLRQFCVGDPMDLAFREKIIDVFVNSVHLYDDKMVVFYNIKGSKQINHFEATEALDEVGLPDLDGVEGSFFERSAPPLANRQKWRFMFLCGTMQPPEVSMKFVTSYSFGKDSALAMHRMVQADHEPVALLTTFNATHGRNWFHGIQPDLMQAVADSLGLPLILCACGDDDYNQGLEDGLRKAKAMGAEACVFGDIDIEGHAAYDQARCDAVGLQCVLPLWQEGRTALLEECLSAVFLPMIKTVRSDLLAETFLGQTLTMPLARRMEQTGADICGENGEYHTFVYGGPLFSAPVAMQAGDIVDLGTHKTIDIQLSQNTLT